MNTYMRPAMIHVEEVKEKRLYSLGIPIGAPYEELYEMLDAFKAHVQSMEEEAKKRHEQEKKDNEEKEENE